MTIKQNMRETAEKLAEGQIDPNSTVASDLFQEIVERVLRRATQNG